MNEHNDHVLNQMPVEKVVTPCHDTVVSANISAQRHQESLPNDLGKTGNLMKSLTVAVGMIYVMTVNVNVEDGLTNGAAGAVKFIDYRMQGTNRPSIIWVLFDDPRIGRKTREQYFNRGFYNNNIQREWTPVFDVERIFIYNLEPYQRIQCPLRPAAGKTVYKAEGATVDEVVVDLTQKNTIGKIPLIHYIALSRVKKLENLYILNMNEAAMVIDEQVTEAKATN